MKKEVFTTPKKSSALNKIKEWSSLNSTFEICGFLGKKDDKYCVIMCENQSRTPQLNFSIDPMDYLLFLDENEPIALFHSHIKGDEEASEKDIMMSENSCLPFLIYSLNSGKFSIHIPKENIADVEVLSKLKI